MRHCFSLRWTLIIHLLRLLRKNTSPKINFVIEMNTKPVIPMASMEKVRERAAKTDTVMRKTILKIDRRGEVLNQ